ncbi:MAG: hypothetical protein ACKN87_07830, partial [Microcystis aeruginosa]
TSCRKPQLGFAARSKGEAFGEKIYGFTDGLLPECFAPTGRGLMKTQGFERRFSQNLHLFREKSHKTLTLPTFHIYSANPS